MKISLLRPGTWVALHASIMRGIVLSLSLLLGACGPSFIEDTGNDAGPDIRLPPDRPQTAKECGDVPPSGSCEGNLAVYCNLKENKLQTKDCGLMDKTCSEDPSRGAICVSQTSDPTSVTCPADLTNDGNCDGNTLSFCDSDNKVQVIDCVTQIEGVPGVCAVDDGFAYCADEVLLSTCGNVSVQGKCTGAKTYQWCSSVTGELASDSCFDNEKCEIVDGWASCVPDGTSTSTSTCDIIGINGVCNLDAVEFCLPGDTELSAYDCANEGRTCCVTDGYADCCDL